MMLFSSLFFVPVQEQIIKNQLSVELQESTTEKETYLFKAMYPFDFQIKNVGELLEITMDKIEKLDIADSVKQNNQCNLESTKKSDQLSLRFQLQNHPYFYSKYYFSHKTLLLELKKYPEKRLYQKVIVLDPGHGAYSDEKELWDYYDCGVIGGSGIFESELNLTIAKLAKEKLEKVGATVILTRETEKNRNNLRFVQRGFLVNDLCPDMYISIHQNGSIYPDVRGTVIYHSNKTAKKLAEAIAKEMIGSTPFPFRYLFNGKFELMESMKLETKILMECAFLSNKEDEKLLLDLINQEKIAQAMVNGIINFFEN